MKVILSKLKQIMPRRVEHTRTIEKRIEEALEEIEIMIPNDVATFYTINEKECQNVMDAVIKRVNRRPDVVFRIKVTSWVDRDKDPKEFNRKISVMREKDNWRIEEEENRGD